MKVKLKANKKVSQIKCGQKSFLFSETYATVKKRRHKPAFCCKFSVGLLVLLQRYGKLVGAGSRLGTATYSTQPCNGFVNVHSFHQGADALRVSAATAKVFHVVNLAVHHVKIYLSGTNSLCNIFHFLLLCAGVEPCALC